jgi:cobalt-zinc-cadmium efflux system outer membrane protein
MQTYYRLLALQQAITDLREVLVGQQNLLDIGQKRFAREDISILELNTLRFDRDQVRNALLDRMREQATVEKHLRQLTAFEEDGRLIVSGDIMNVLIKKTPIPDRHSLYSCATENRPDVKAAKLAVEVLEAELRLAQARQIPNVSFGPRYKRENNDNLFGGEIALPLPFFNRNQEEVATALANQNVSRAELEGRLLAVKQDINTAHTKLELARDTIGSYGKDYSDELEKIMALTRKAHESGEMSIFEFSTARDRFIQARSRSIDAALAYAQAMVELDTYARGCLN